MEDLKQRRLEFLDDTIKYYSEDTSRRGISESGGYAYKNFKTGNMCAIGRHLQHEDKDKLENAYQCCVPISSCSNDFWNCIPENIRELGEGFLSDIQVFHDNDTYWNKWGITEYGKEKYKILKSKYC